jgi:hypothetical protein
MSKIYVATSWRNPYTDRIVFMLRQAGHEVYDFREPAHGSFNFSQIDPKWMTWSAQQFLQGLQDPRARAGFSSDMAALKWCDTCVLVLPCGRSAHLELGWATGMGKRTVVLTLDDINEPELMYLMVNRICTSRKELLDYLCEKKAA